MKSNFNKLWICVLIAVLAYICAHSFANTNQIKPTGSRTSDGVTDKAVTPYSDVIASVATEVAARIAAINTVTSAFQAADAAITTAYQAADTIINNAIAALAARMTTAEADIDAIEAAQPTYHTNASVTAADGTIVLNKTAPNLMSIRAVIPAEADTLASVTGRGATTSIASSFNGGLEGSAITEGGVGVPNLNQITATAPITASTVSSSRNIALDVAALETTLAGAGFANSILTDSGDPFLWTQSPAGTWTLKGTGGTWDLPSLTNTSALHITAPDTVVADSTAFSALKNQASIIDLHPALISYFQPGPGTISGTQLYSIRIHNANSDVPTLGISDSVVMIADNVTNATYFTSLTYGGIVTQTNSDVYSSLAPGVLHVRGYDPALNNYWAFAPPGSGVFDNILSNRDGHIQRHGYIVHKAIVGARNSLTYTDFSLQINSGTDDSAGDTPGDFPPIEGVQTLSVYTDTFGTKFANHDVDPAYQGLDSTQFWFDDTVNAPYFVGDGINLGNVIHTGDIAAGELTGTYPNPGIGVNVVSSSKFRQSVGLSVVGRSANSTGNVDDITASAVGQVLRYSGSALSFGAIDLADTDAVSGLLPNANIATISTAGKVSDSALSSNIPLKNGSNAYSGLNTFTGAVSSSVYIGVGGAVKIYDDGATLNMIGRTYTAFGSNASQFYLNGPTGKIGYNNSSISICTNSNESNPHINFGYNATFSSAFTQVFTSMAIGGRIGLNTSSAPSAGAYVQTPSLNIGTGTDIVGHLSGTGTLDFPSVANGAKALLTITVTGAATGDTVNLGPPSTFNSGFVYSGFVSATNTVTVTVGNLSGGAVDLASGSWRADVWKH
jgi:hypothetical protein